MFGETRPTSKMSFTFFTGVANLGKCAWWASHTIATILVTDMCHITPTTFMACFTYVPCSHCTCKVSYHMIISFDIVVEWVKMFGRVDLPFVHYVVTPESFIHNYLIVAKMFLTSLKFGDPPHLVRSIPVCCSNASTTGRIFLP